MSDNFGDYRPVSRAEAAAAAAAPMIAQNAPQTAAMPAPVSTTAPEPVTAPAPVLAVPAAIPAPAPPRFVNGRTGEIPLAHPIEYDGVLWDVIPLRRPSSAEVGRYFERLVSLGENESEYYPVFASPDGTPVPDAVLRFLDDDDRGAVMEAAEDFLPARLLQLREAQRHASPPSAGDSTGPTSST